MRTVKLLFPFVFGLILAFGLVGGLALANRFLVPNATTLYVDADATGASTGLSWTDAFTNLQDALTVAISGTEIWVAEGVYYPDVGAGQINDMVTSTFVLTDGVALYGGFDPSSGATEFAERDWKTHITVLNGDIDHETYPDITDYHGVVTSTANITGTNAYHVVSSAGIIVTAEIDGFSITAGQANGAVPDNRGGGYHCDGFEGDCSPSLKNITFSGNHAYVGGAMCNDGVQGSSSPSLVNVSFSGNTADHSGGAMFNNGAVGISSPRLSNVTFSGNSARDDGGAMLNSSYDGSSSPSLSNVIFTDNLAGAYGGAMANDGTYGTSSPMLMNVTFYGNSAGSGGGAIANIGFRHISSPSLNNVIFSGNSADACGGAIANFSGIGSSSPSLDNVTFTGNTANYGGAICTAGAYAVISDPSLSNAILWGNTAVISGSQIYNNEYARVTINTSLVQDGLTGGIEGSETVTDGGGNLDADPLFVRNPHLGSNDYGDLHLQPGSPAIDGGTNDGCPATDLDGNHRPLNATCDMGAYEFVPLVLVTKSVHNPTPKPGETITFTIQVNNSLTETLTGGLLSDTLPAGLNFLGPITLEPPGVGAVGTLPPILATNLTIAATSKITLTFPVIVSKELEIGTQITNLAVLSSTEVITPMLGSVTLTIYPDDIYLPLVFKGQ
jgi:uncharacterized repeat protein (TIGR01451 family)